jgi:hypothetical protein
MQHLVSVVGGLQYDICVLTGDYRGKTYGPFEKSLEIIDELQAQLKGPVYGVLGNHDSIRMAPSMEAMGICMLFNECVHLEAAFRRQMLWNRGLGGVAGATRRVLEQERSAFYFEGF